MLSAILLIMGIILAVLSAISLSIGNISLKKSYKDLSPAVDFVLFSFFCMLLWVPVGLLTSFNTKLMLEGIIVGIISAIFGQAIYIYVLSKGEVSITATILSTFSIYTIVFSVLFNGESLSGITAFLIGLAVLGTVIVTLPKRVDKKDLAKVGFILWAVFAAIAIGASDVITKHYITKASLGNFLVWVSIAQLVVAFIYAKLSREPLNQISAVFNRFKDYKYALLGTGLVSIATLSLFGAFNFAPASLVSPIVATYPVFTGLLAVMILKEKLQFREIVGLSLVLIAVIGTGIVHG
jgi:drug/metabolite transporter (DMT)-like permease